MTRVQTLISVGLAAFSLSGVYFCAEAWAVEGLSTTFVDVTAEDVPLGVSYEIHDPRGKGLVLRNLGDRSVRIQVDVLTPDAVKIRSGAAAIPDVSWIQIKPRVLEILPHAEQSCAVVIAVPNQRIYLGRHYQAMIWSHGIHSGQDGMSVSAGLLSRLRFHTERRRKKLR